MKYIAQDETRLSPIDGSNMPSEPYRTPWRRDFARIIHSPSFRRLSGKTQLFPGLESDFFRNRLTHSLEVAQIAKSIAIKLNWELKNEGSEFQIDLDLVEASALAHDIGHPPFGHLGEHALDERMIEFGGFEGNAQTLRILSTLEKRESHAIDEGRVGLNLCYRTLASILKYDNDIALSKTDRIARKQSCDGPVKGYYGSDKGLVDKIKLALVGSENLKILKSNGIPFRTIECDIMDISDDIAYSVYDLEDTLKAGFVKPIDLLSAADDIVNEVAKRASKALTQEVTHQEVKEVFELIFEGLYVDVDFDEATMKTDDFGSIIKLIGELFLKTAVQTSNELASNGYLRSKFSSRLVGEFIRAVRIEKISDIHPILTRVEMVKEVRLKVEVLKQVSYVLQIMSPKLRIVEYRGKEIVAKIFDVLSNTGADLLPTDFRQIYNSSRQEADRMRCICDFIAGMTDRYAIEFYSRLVSEHPQTIFKPL